MWSWISGAGKTAEGCVARSGDGRIIGFVHFREVPRPVTGARGGFIDDLFVDKAQRGKGVSEKLIQAVKNVGRSRGWTDIRWVAAPDNDAAKRMNERLAARTDLVTYEVRV